MANSHTHTHKPPWQDDVLACYPNIIKRLEAIKCVKKVMDAKDLNSISSSKTQKPLDGTVFLIYDGLTPSSTNDNNRGQTMIIGFSIILTMRNYTPKPNTMGIGQIQTAIMQSLQGYEPRQLDAEEKETGSYLTVSTFKQVNALPIRYEDGFAYFPMRFTAEVAVIAD